MQTHRARLRRGLLVLLALPAIAAAEPSVHVVRSGDTLGEIAQQYGVSVGQLQSWNGLKSSRIYVRQQLRVGEESAAPATHRVQPGETLYRIAKSYDLSVAELQSLNSLKGNLIVPGQELRVQKVVHHQVHTVRRGDSLGAIAQQYGVSLAALKNANGIRGSIIHPGQRLDVPMYDAQPLIQLADIDWEALGSAPRGVSTVARSNGPYFYAAPQAAYQTGKNYNEGSSLQPLSAFERAKALFDVFDARLSALGRLSHELDGFHVVLDPGHGGVDPGAIVRTVDGNGDPIYVVEDEYVYDITLRVYALLRLHGARVTMTLLSPNHLIRSNVPAASTFVHERNEVFHWRELNAQNRASSWPRGGRPGLEARRRVIDAALRDVPAQNTVFLSLHADNTPTRGREPIVLYYQRRGVVDQRSQRFAEQFRHALGAGTRAKGQSLWVLRENPADVAVLVEIRNIAYKENSWALRFAEDRQADAQRIVDGILDYAQGSRRIARAR